MNRRALAIAKYAVALLLLGWVLQQADLERIAAHAIQVPWPWLLLACVCFGGAQLMAVLRMNAYYAQVGRPIALGYAIRLHYVALFYNIILPGGVGGDGYKVYLLHRAAGYPVKEGIKIQILTRLNGLLVLGFTICLTLPFLPVPWPVVWLAATGGGIAVLGAMAYLLLVRYLLKASLAMEWRALPYSLGVQGLNVLAMMALWYGLSPDHALLACYVFLFQLAAVAGMIPITIGGLGIRELTFFYGAQLIGAVAPSQPDAELGITLSLLFFALTLCHALIGLRWIGMIGKSPVNQV